MQQGYLALKLSWELFAKAPETLSPPEQERVDDVARKQAHIEQRILATPEAANVVVPATTLANRLAEIRARYPGQDEFNADLDRNGLDLPALEKSIESDLRVEAVLDKVAAAAGEVSIVDAEIYYRLHPEAFDRPEARRLRHILITYDKPAEKAKALSQLESLRNSLKSADEFGKAALRWSQCPTAMEGGVLGVVKREQLYAELEAAAFALAENEISAILESPIGLHIIRCDEIFPSGMQAFEEVSEKIVERLTDKRRQQAQRDWIKQALSVGVVR